MRRFDKKKNIQKLNEQLNKKSNSLTENSWADELENDEFPEEFKGLYDDEFGPYDPETLDGDPLGPTSDDLESPVELQHRQEVEDGIRRSLEAEGSDKDKPLFTPAMGEPSEDEIHDYDQDERSFTPHSRFGESMDEGEEKSTNLLSEQAIKAFKNLCGLEVKKKVVTESKRKYDEVDAAMAKLGIGLTRPETATHGVSVDGNVRVFRPSYDEAKMAAEKLGSIINNKAIEVVEIPSKNTRNGVNENTTKLFDKMFGVKLIKESVSERSMSPEEANVIFDKIKSHIESTGTADMREMNLVEYFIEYGEMPNLNYTVEANDGEETLYMASINFIPKITYAEAPDPGDRWTPPSGGHVEYECKPVNMYLFYERPYYDENGEVKFTYKEFKTDDPNMVNALFDEAFITSTDKLNQEMEEYLIDGDDGFKEPDSYSSYGARVQQGYNKYGTDFNPGRDLK